MNNLKGNFYGSLEVICKDTSINKSSHAYWLCHCHKCGKLYSIRGSSFISGNTTTCKCNKRCYNYFEVISSEITKMYDNKGNFTLIDTEDVKLLSKNYWYKDNHSRMKYWRSSDSKKMLHTFLVPHGDSLVTDHVLGDLDDNRKKSLRLCTLSQNNRNIRLNKRSLPIGVSYDKVQNRYCSYISVNGSQVKKYFKNKEDAIKQRQQFEHTFYNDGFIPSVKSQCRKKGVK